MHSIYSKNKTSSQNRIILSFIFIFFISVLIICTLMYRIFSKNLSESLHTRATEVIDIIDYMAQTSGESHALIRGVETLAANRDIKLIIVRINEPPVVIASNKSALIGLPTNEIFTDNENSQSFQFDADTDQYTAISSIWLENKFSNGQFTKALVGVVFDTYKTRTMLQEQILNTSLYLILTTIFAIGLIYLLTNKYIFKPLEIIKASLINNNSENEFSPILLTNNDEIGTVANTLNKLFTDLYTSKKKLRENTERYNLALQGTKAGLFDWDINADSIYCSSSLTELLGINKNNFKPDMNWLWDHTHPEDREAAQSALISHLKLNTEYDVEARILHKSGEYIWMRARGQAIRDEASRAIRMVGYFADISKRKANEHFINSLYLLSADATLPLDYKINSILMEGLSYLDLDCGIICNIKDGICSVIYSQGSNEYAINEQSTFDLNDTYCSYTIKENNMVAIHNANNEDLEHLPAYTNTGIKCYIGTPLYVHGNIYGTVSFIDRKPRLKPFAEREKSFLRLISQWIGNEMMRSQYIDYLHETESRLEDAVEELTNTNSELESFTHVASHDLQEPLRMITNFTGLLDKHYGNNLDETAKEYLKILTNSASQMRILIKDLLEYAHASKEDEKLENLDLNIVINNVYNNLEKQFHETKAIIQFNNLPVIYANKASMTSLFQNLISNGIKFQSKNNQPKIEIKAVQHTDSWVIEVKDNGIGIEDTYQSKIFEPFKRLHAKNEYMGTGIGLAVCKKIISRMGGTMWIQSKIGAGSTFFISIPNHINQTGKAA